MPKSDREASSENVGVDHPSRLIDRRIDELGDWRGEILRLLRRLVLQAIPDVEEDTKWRKPSNPRGVPTWSSAGLVCTGEVYKDKVKVTFARGAALDDPSGVFNSSLGAGVRRAIDLRHGDTLDQAAFKALVRAAAKLNNSRA